MSYSHNLSVHLAEFSFSYIFGLPYNFFAGVLLPLSWAIRMKIAFGAAKGLAYLHEAEKPVIYRDFKTSNILLDMVGTRNKCFLLFLTPSRILTIQFNLI